MACASCNRHKLEGKMQGVTSAQNIYPFNANDIVKIEGNEVNRFQAPDWDNSVTKLLIVLPTGDRVVCATEVGAMKDWYPKFKELGCELILVSSDHSGALMDWINSEPLLKDPPFKVFSSYMLPNRLEVTEDGRAKRASIFITPDNEIIKIEHFEKVGRSFAELHRTFWAYTQDTFCGEGWENPLDNIKSEN